MVLMMFFLSFFLRVKQSVNYDDDDDDDDDDAPSKEWGEGERCSDGS